MLFHRNHQELRCERCGRPVNKKDSCVFDYTLQGRNKDAAAVRLCQDCCFTELEMNLRSYPQKAVVVQPSAKHNAYAFYTFQVLREGDKHSIGKDDKLQQIEDLESLLPKDGTKCAVCSREANIIWCPANLFKGCDPCSAYLNLYERANCVPLCTECMIREFRKKVEEEQIRFNWIYPRIDGRVGYYTPWDA